MRNRTVFIIDFLVMVLILLFLLVVNANSADASLIDLNKIKQIESSGNPLAHNKADDSRGLYQITKIALEDFNNFHPREKYTMDDLWDPVVNERIARWMFEYRIPQMLRHFKKPVTVKNILISYNCGISCVVHNRDLPSITKQYLRKYGIQ